MNDDKKYGVPEQKKFPMPDAAHVRSAIRFFNYVEPRYEKKLAKAILARMKEYGLSFDDFTVGEENRFSKYIPKNELMHHGIMGQKWGVRRFQNEDGTLTELGKKRYYRTGLTKSGDSFTVKEMEPGKLAKFLQNHSRRIKELADKSINAEILDKNGKKIGDLELFDEGNKSLNINWLGVDEDQRGKGYATSVLRDTIEYAKQNGYEQMTLEVPGHSPDARHIYEKLGFKETKVLSTPEDDPMWSGLTAMTLNLNDLKHSAVRAGSINGEDQKYGIPKNELKHYGILGMHWGIRRYQNEDGTLTEAGKRHYAKLDDRWADRHATKIQNKAYKKSQREMKKVERQLRREYDPRGRQYMNAYNQNLARIMSTKVTDLSTPSGKAVKFVAKRGEYGVYFAMASRNYDMNKVKNGVWGSGRVAYKNTILDKSESRSNRK